LTALLRRDRAIILAALAAVTILAWLYLEALAGGMAGSGMDMSQDMAGMAMAAGPAPWTAGEAALMLAMWWVMMAGMMLPSAAPMILAFATVSRRRRERGEPFVPTLVFAAGYLLVWGAFGAAATLAQWGLQQRALVAMNGAASPALAGALFLAAGLYQLTPVKQACLRRCRSPFDFLLNYFREGAGGALRMGVAHGLYCLGCCWLLMALLFAEGVMNLLWVAALAALVFVEKLFPAGSWLARAGGVAMLAAGAYLLAQA
jgi:predicted metal-binding membrane protein